MNLVLHQHLDSIIQTTTTKTFFCLLKCCFEMQGHVTRVVCRSVGRQVAYFSVALFGMMNVKKQKVTSYLPPSTYLNQSRTDPFSQSLNHHLTILNHTIILLYCILNHHTILYCILNHHTYCIFNHVLNYVYCVLIVQTLRMVITSALGLFGEGYFSHWPLSFQMLSTLVSSDFQVRPCQPREREGERMGEGGRR